MLRIFAFFIFVLFFLGELSAQAFQGDTIKLNNPSFEDFPKNSVPPRGWWDCGFEGETPPDVQPLGGFEVTKPPYHGRTYLGMVVRDNETWESVSQRLYKPLRRGKCYEFSISLSRSEIYLSLSRETNEPAHYITPAKLRIFGGNAFCARVELLSESNLVTNTRWLEYKFRFEPLDNYTYITFEAYYQTPTLFPYNGNILLDNGSDIVEIPCEDPVKEPETDEEPVASNNPPPKINTSPTPGPKAEAPVGEESKPVILKDLTTEKIKEGQTIRIEKLNFKADSYEITDDSYEVLGELYSFLKNNSSVIVEIGGHTNTIPADDYCDQLSENRAKAVADYLHDKGIPYERLRYKGYGKRKPLTYDTSQEGRKKNQRVEIKILSVNG